MTAPATGAWMRWWRACTIPCGAPRSRRRPGPCGRGYFAGIAVGPQWRGHGLGKLRFYRLLQAEQAAGARYMTLFTGVDNPAGRMYRKAGFRDVRTFAAMEKELL